MLKTPCYHFLNNGFLYGLLTLLSRNQLASSMAPQRGLWHMQRISAPFPTFLVSQKDVRNTKCTQNQWQLRCFLTSARHKNPTKWLRFLISGLGTWHWEPQKCAIIFYRRRGCATESGTTQNHTQNRHHQEYEDAKKLPASCPENEVCREATHFFSNWPPQAQLITAVSSSLFSMQSSSECLSLKKGWGQGTNTQRAHTKLWEEEHNVPCTTANEDSWSQLSGKV